MGFLVAVHFLTTIPVATRRIFTPTQLGASLAYYPLVGSVIGVLLVVVSRVLSLVFDAHIVAALTLTAWALVTGGLHLDGLMDACDGLFAHRPADERLRIMRDVHVGAWGALGGALLLITKFAALSALLAQPNAMTALLLAPTLARWALTLSVVAFPYGRAEGWGQTLKEQAGPRQLLLATIGAFAITLLIQPTVGMTAFALVLLVTFMLARFALDRLPGLTGDVYGMIAEICEVVVLLTFAARWT